MSVVKKLCIQGIRSFSPGDNKGQWIEFESPLNLILGVNGSGKTTIIETLKFAITSQLPPNCAHGASFINDPKLGNQTDSIAKILLILEGANGETFTTSRRLKAAIKNAKGDLTFSQLEAAVTVQMSKSAKPRELSNKVADCKFEMCRIMGVSEAVLNHVIFCHQEDSCWPLDEGKKVKEKFDSIFNTAAYNNCLNQFGKEEKELQGKIKVEKEGLLYVKENRDAAAKKRRDLDDKRIKLREQNDRMIEYEREIKAMEVKLREFQALEKEYAKKQSEVAEKKTMIDAIGKQIKKLREDIKEEFRGGITQLKEFILQFKEQSTGKTNQLKKVERERASKENEYRKLDSQRTSLLKEEGMLQQEENANEKRLKDLNVLMLDIVSAMKKIKSDSAEASMSTSFTSYLEACKHESGNLSYDAVIKTLTSALRMKDSELQKVKEEFEVEEAELQTAIDDVRSKLSATETEKKMKRQQLEESKKRHADVTKRLQALDGSNEALAQMEIEEQEYAEQIETIEKSGSLKKYETSIKTLGVEVKEIDTKISSLNDTINVLARDKGKMEQITLLTRQIEQKGKDSDEIMSRVEDDLTALLGEIPKENLAKTVDTKANILAKELREKKSELSKREVNSQVQKNELKRVGKELTDKEDKLKDQKEQISDVLQGKEYSTMYTEVSENLEKKQTDCYYSEAASFLYKKYISKLNKKDCCPLCKRDFEAKALTKKLIKEVEGDITRMQQDVPKFKEEIESLKSQQEQILKVKPAWDECERLETDVIPKLEKKRDELQESLSKAEEDIEDINSTIQILETDASLASKSRSDVAVYEQCKKEVKKLEDQKNKLENSRDPEAKRCKITLSDAQSELRELRETVESKRSEKESTEKKRDKMRDELAKLQERKNKVQKEKLRITAELQNRNGLETQKKELEADTKDLQAKINELTQSLPSLNNDIAKANKNKSACTQRKDEALKKLRTEKENMDKQKYTISELHKKVEEFEKKKGRFAEIQQRVAECKDKLAQCDKEKEEIFNQIDALKKDIANQELRQRDLDDNLELKQNEEEVARLTVELKKKEEILSQAEDRGAAAEKREVQTKYQRTEAKFHELNGSKKELTKSIRELEIELKSPIYSNVEKDYVTRVAKKTVYEKALRDVGRYKTALDLAIMQFHHKKMERINKILFEYWRRIYKGNDIDKIMIKTDAENKLVDAKVKVKEGGGKRKQYNYRVVMSRRGVEIDMRGRCSAGQRVLASIIIRIALAESFGARCGIITLDEPTTNLDQKNINSLASALADLAEKMQGRRNFQLIVITHDHEFTKRLSAVDAIENYWMVDRDKDGFSQIQKVAKRGHGALD